MVLGGRSCYPGGAHDPGKEPCRKPRCALALACWLLVLPGRGRAEEGTFDSNGVKIHYIVEGRGEPVLLIHGFTVNIQKQWGLPGIIEALAKDYRVIALDNRGHGKSGKPHDPKQYGTEMVEDAVRLLDHLKIDKAHVVGYSMGATITLKLLATHPDRLLTATLGGSGGIREAAVPLRYEVLAESLEQGKGFGPLIEALTPAGKPKPTADQIKLINEALQIGNDTKALAAVIRGLKDLAVSDQKLKANRVPTLALIGEIDPLKKGVDELDGRMANLRVVVIDGADHITAFALPEFIKELRGFLGKQGQKAGDARGVFKIKGPPAVAVKQGGKVAFSLDVDRSRDFTEDVALTFPGLPKGLKVEPDKLLVKAGDAAKAQIGIAADRDASAGDHVLTILATPARGEAAELRVKIKVEP